MEYRQLGRTGLQVSLTSLGSGGPSLLGQTHGTTPAAARNLITRAFDHGINFFDTAAGYDESETLLGHALANIPRHNFILATKYSPVDESGEVVKAEEVQRSINRSLDRLGLDHVDVMQVHGLEAQHYQQVLDIHLPVLQDAKAAGKIRYLGVTERFENDPLHEMFSLMVADGHFDTFMVGYNFLHQTAERLLLQSAASANIGIIVMVAVRRTMANPRRLNETIADLKTKGLLAHDAVPSEKPLDWLIHEDVDSIPEAAYRYVLEPPAVSTVLTGTSNPDHLDANVAGMAKGPLPISDRQRLQALFGNLDLGLGD